MNKIAASSLIIFASLMAANTHAEPVRLALLSNVEGKILVNKGKGFVSAKSGTSLMSGDRVIALDGAHAAVVYPDGCVTKLAENSLLALEKGVSCGKQAVRTGGHVKQPLRYAQAIGGTMTDAATGGTVETVGAAGVTGGLTVMDMVVVGLAVTSVGVAENNNKDDTPISPQ